MRGHLARAARKVCLVLALLGLTLSVAVPPAAADDRQTVVLPLSGTFRSFSSEPIDVTGSVRVRVVTETAPGGGGTARVTSTLLRTTGIGQVSGGLYRFVGSDTNVAAWPPDPITPLTFHPRFYNIYPPDPIIPTVPPHPIRPVIVDVTLTPDGTITNIGAMVDPGSVDNP
ncbi:hypothetical protein [Streptomyces bambusae]|uniref:Uncharacterized protein n=1 Tax=Streptomyces bambusae TaxID=1550616 RepID=A0ABS6ZDS4_9ACTN|nr:hypothetical protein [Streptomyces bambusae]MBW5485920.1 hypothetical protein [Streptomyces bambusae]